MGERPDYLPARTKRAGVFVNADTGEILSRAKAFGLDLVQLYGDVPTAQCRELRAAGLSIIRAINIGSSEDAAKASAIQGYDYLLFDTKTPSFGGSGKMFNSGGIAIIQRKYAVHNKRRDKRILAKRHIEVQTSAFCRNRPEQRLRNIPGNERRKSTGTLHKRNKGRRKPAAADIIQINDINKTYML